MVGNSVEGLMVGNSVGVIVGSPVGIIVGITVGYTVGFICDFERGRRYQLIEPTDEISFTGAADTNDNIK
jgi:hypothetical protein